MRGAPTKLVTLRLGKDLIAALKAIAKAEGVRYQTLIKRVLERERSATLDQPDR